MPRSNAPLTKGHSGLSCEEYKVSSVSNTYRLWQLNLSKALPPDERSPEDRAVLELAKVRAVLDPTFSLRKVKAIFFFRLKTGDVAQTAK